MPAGLDDFAVVVERSLSDEGGTSSPAMGG